jgi:hypothetical protein
MPLRILQAVVLLFASVATAGAQSVRVTVTDGGSGAPVAGAMVRVESDSGTLVRAGFSDERGTITLALRDPGRYAVTATRGGYLPSTQPLLFEAEGNARVTLAMRPSPLTLDTLRVIAPPTRAEMGSQTFDRRKANGRGIYLDSAYIAQRSARHAAELLESVPGIDVLPVHGRTGWRRPVSRMGGRCLNYLVNGLPYYGGWPRFSTLEETLRRNSVVAVEVYRVFDEVPPELQRYARTPRACGLIVYWTADGWTSPSLGAQTATQ